MWPDLAILNFFNNRKIKNKFNIQNLFFLYNHAHLCHCFIVITQNSVNHPIRESFVYSNILKFTESVTF